MGRLLLPAAALFAAKSALAGAGESLPRGAMALTGGSTGERVDALLEVQPSASVPVEAAFGSVAVLGVGLAATQLHHLATLVLHGC